MNEKNRIKTPTTFAEQVNILKSRNLIVENEENAEEILSRINYYRFSAYTLTYKTNDFFSDKITFNEIYQLYIFDKKLRNLTLGLLETIEVLFRTQIAYYIAHEYGSLGYTDGNNFYSRNRHKKMMEKIESAIRKSDEIFIKHHRSHYNDHFPIWVVIEVFSFGMLSILFSNLKETDRNTIANNNFNVPYKYIKSWLHSLSTLRNICAHYGRTYDKPLTIKPMISNKDRKIGANNEYIFGAIFVAGKLMPDAEEWNSYIVNLSSLIEEYEIINLDLIGFPDNWENLLQSVNGN